MDEEEKNLDLKAELLELIPVNWHNLKNLIRKYKYTNKDLELFVKHFKEVETTRRIAKIPYSVPEEKFLSLLNKKYGIRT